MLVQFPFSLWLPGSSKSKFFLITSMEDFVACLSVFYSPPPFPQSRSVILIHNFAHSDSL